MIIKDYNRLQESFIYGEVNLRLWFDDSIIILTNNLKSKLCLIIKFDLIFSYYKFKIYQEYKKKVI